MGPESEALTHEEIWDDSALIDSWNQALEEYKRYHSIRAKGGSIDDVLAEADKKTEAAEEDRRPSVDEGEIEPSPAEVVMETEQHGNQMPLDPNINVGPQTLLGSVRDDGLKKLLMSWYYAGYYTGLYEGQQQAHQQRQSRE